jgi:hypothetical protein
MWFRRVISMFSPCAKLRRVFIHEIANIRPETRLHSRTRHVILEASYFVVCSFYIAISCVGGTVLGRSFEACYPLRYLAGYGTYDTFPNLLLLIIRFCGFSNIMRGLFGVRLMLVDCQRLSVRYMKIVTKAPLI